MPCKPILQPIQDSAFNTMTLKFEEQSRVRHLVEGFGQIQIYNIDGKALIDGLSCIFEEGKQVTETRAAPMEAML
jgi:hypothetical protein